LAKLVGDVCRHVTRPTLRRVEGYDAQRVVILAAHEITDQSLAVGVLFVRLASSPTKPAEVAKHKIGVLVGTKRHD
jgi:hypothetical protein